MNNELETMDSMLLTNIVKRTGPKTDPYGTSLVTGMECEMRPLSTTCCCLNISYPH